jgi:ABC-type lipoprotein release transport system permease subunit
MRLTAAGLLIGGAIAAIATPLLRVLPVTVRPPDPLTVAGVALGIALIALIACGVPARRAWLADPAMSLRED